MRRLVKRRLDELFAEMRCRHEECMEAMEEQDYGKLQKLFAESQQAAIMAGSIIEDSEPQAAEKTRLYEATVKKLEEYCELTWQAAGSCVRKEEIPRMAFKKLGCYVDEVNRYVREEITETLEAVFFPYKASMWDSLESVWQAAEADPDCEAYVVPIPYFDKNADGSITTMHYEGGEFPPYVPITDWQSYCTAERHPDMVYIHNPYDNTNRVTTVYPDHYAKELRKHTDMLVYIPYFVCMNDNVPKDFCVLPGTIYADRVIVQSERIRQIYIQEFRNFETENRCEGIFGDAEQKFVALGSPKYDKVLATTKENVSIPEDWMKKIQRADGVWKKVILYNTSVVKLLEGNEQVLAKLRSVFDIFRQREDVVLLWRPHPLSSTACNAMRPQLLEDYQKIVEKYKEEDWGIYDDTSQLHRAIAISDAYYGDTSSLVELYRLTGKPMMIQNVEVV